MEKAGISNVQYNKIAISFNNNEKIGIELQKPENIQE